VSTDTTDLAVVANDAAFIKSLSVTMPKHCTAERFAKIAVAAMNRSPNLRKCSRVSFVKCMQELSQWGLEPDGRRAHLIPRKKGDSYECTLVVDYKGIVELIIRSGVVSSIHADIVCENDLFDYNRGEILEHRVNLKKDRGPAYAVYCLVRLKDGSEKCEVMSMNEICAIRDKSEGYKAAMKYNNDSSPWISYFDEMAKKTVFRRLSKWMPWSAEIRTAIETGEDDIIDGGEAQVIVEQQRPKRLADLTPVDDEPEPQDTEPADAPAKPKVAFATCMAKLRNAKTLAEVDEAVAWVEGGDTSGWIGNEDPEFWAFVETRKAALDAKASK